MTKDELWAIYTKKNPQFLTEGCSFTAAGLKKFFDTTYSPRQISECYKSIGMEVGMKETQSALLYQRVRNAIIPILAPGGIVLSFGWNSVGMGKKHGFEQIEIMLCCHGGAHNDTICLAERKL